MLKQYLLLLVVSIFSLTANSQTIKSPSSGGVRGGLYHQRLDDLTWENEYCAFRAYGPAQQKKGEKSYGYDIWVKNTPDTIVPLRYRLHFPPKGVEKKSFHKDWGNGMDCYDVGSSLGCCTAALLDKNDSIIFLWCWQKCDIIENGPDTFKVHLVYSASCTSRISSNASNTRKSSVASNARNASDTLYTEHRLITACRGQRLNKCEVWYEGLTEPTKIAVGIVVHDSLTTENYYTWHISSSDKTTNEHLPLGEGLGGAYGESHGSDGVIYIGAICPEAKEMKYAQGHILAISELKPGHHYTYYFGATWSKYDVHSFDEWKKVLMAQKPF